MKQKVKVLFYTDQPDDVKILLGKRTSGGDTFWWLPGGGVDAGEKPFEALLRELNEELDLGDNINKIVKSYLQSNKLPKSVRYNSSNAQYIVYLVPVPVEVIVDLITIKEEFDEVEWHSYSQLPDNMSREYKILKPLLCF